MSGKAPPSRLASDAVHSRLRGEILAGELAPGDPVPSERALAERLGVNRHAVREALKRLQQAGLVRISQGGATRVLDWRRSAGLEVLLDLMERDAAPPAELIRSVLEMRASIGVDAARRCAERGDAAVRERVGSLAESTATRVETADPAALEEFVALWQAIVEGSGNLAYLLGLNSLNAALDAYPDLGRALSPRDPASLRRLGESIAKGNDDGAARAAAELLQADLDITPD